MNKSDLITSMSEKNGLTKKDSELALKSFIESVEEALSKGEKVQLVGFGSFEARKRAERTVQVQPGKPELGTKIIPEKVAPVFSAGKEFKDKIKNK